MVLCLCPNYLNLCFPLCVPGGGGVWAAGSGYVSVEPAGPSSSLHVFLAPAVCSADLLLLQHQRPAYLEGEAAFPLSHQVKSHHCELDQGIGIIFSFWNLEF